MVKRCRRAEVFFAEPVAQDEILAYTKASNYARAMWFYSFGHALSNTVALSS